MITKSDFLLMEYMLQCDEEDCLAVEYPARDTFPETWTKVIGESVDFDIGSITPIELHFCPEHSKGR